MPTTVPCMAPCGRASICNNNIAFTVHRKSGVYCPSWIIFLVSMLTRLRGSNKKKKGTTDWFSSQLSSTVFIRILTQVSKNFDDKGAF